jgi:uncharacterized protein
MSDFRQQLEQYIRREAHPKHKYSHQPRLYALTKQIAAAIAPAPKYDDDVVFAAAFLHDLGVFVGHRPENPAELERWNHVDYTCKRAPEILRNMRFPELKISAVLDVIQEHQPQDKPRSIEATLLRDADILEQLGAIGILRTAAKLGSDTRFHVFSDARNSLQRALDTLPGKIELEATRKLAKPRIAILQSFLVALTDEASNNLD